MRKIDLFFILAFIVSINYTWKISCCLESSLAFQTSFEQLRILHTQSNKYRNGVLNCIMIKVSLGCRTTTNILKLHCAYSVHTLNTCLPMQTGDEEWGSHTWRKFAIFNYLSILWVLSIFFSRGFVYISLNQSNHKIYNKCYSNQSHILFKFLTKHVDFYAIAPF